MAEKLKINVIKKVLFKWLFSVQLPNGRKGAANAIEIPLCFRGCEDTHSSYSSLTSHNTSSSSNDHMQEDDSVTTVSSKSTVKSVSTKTSGSTR